MRTWRERITPAEVGLPPGGRRRAPGLRREELGLLAGISVDYIVRLEQGRATAPSAQVVEALARALRLDSCSRDLLFRLAGLALPSPGTVSAHLTPGVQRLLDRMSGTPVSVHDAAWNLVTANDLYRALFGDPSDRNVIRQYFVGGGFERVRHTPEQAASFESAMVGDLLTASARYPADRGLRELITDLRAESSRFAELWDSGRAGVHESSCKTIEHPVVGSLYLDCDVLSVPCSDLRIVAYTAQPGSASESRLALLAVVGDQALI
ncbi:transcriptional regulator [Paractinoplanes durhamensis]|uniref:Transcriptional regulator n=2 Tax=Paractinoplanes durhamensis TaxID=113563 RepID=A0ABQ3ZC55_9ACTN|nr:transcriptional regulator [Actinoplanes durhamensis]